MISISLPPTKRSWSTLSFNSTLYLCPVLDLLLVNIPSEIRYEIRLGLQEALVNAAKHGNKLDPSKSVVVSFLVSKSGYSWVISDQGDGFTPKCACELHANCATSLLPPEESENGRGLCILHQVFDQVQWNANGTQLRLSKQTCRNRWGISSKFLEIS
ncbi:MAG: anti-sigma regulatory factor [Snowella sp.]|nr:anti-sigma regulatory factor [Snowella sp.]